VRLRPLTALVPIALLAGTALAGCGGPGEDFDPGARPGAEGITAVIEIYAKAIANGDGPRACSLVSKAVQDEVIGRSGVTGNCLEAVKAISEPLSEEAKNALADAQVTDISGEATTNATATLVLDGIGAGEATTALGGSSFSMSVEEARWGIASIQP
jgi:hypothetical protein